MARISERKKARILELYLEGIPRDQIANKLKVSGETVSRHIRQFKRPLSEKAAELLDDLRLLSRELRKTRKTLPEALSIARLHSKLEKIGVNAENIEYFVSASKKIAKEMNVEAKDFAKVAIKLDKLEVETGKNYYEITEDFEYKANKIGQLKEKIKKLEEKKEESKKELQNQLRENKLTRKDLAYASTLRDALAPYGFSLKDTTKIPTLIRHIHNCGKDPKKVLAKLEAINNLDQTISELDKNEKKRRQELDTIENETEKARLKLSKLQREVQTLEKRNGELAHKFLQLETHIKLLTDKEDKMEKEIEIAECLSSALLTKKPMNIDTLWFFASGLKQVKYDPTADLTQYRKIYEPQIRKLLKDTFLSVFGHEFVRKDHYLKLQAQVENLSEKVKKLETENAVLAAEKDNLTDSLKTCKEQNKRLIKKMDRTIETYQKGINRSLKFDFPTT